MNKVIYLLLIIPLISNAETWIDVHLASSHSEEFYITETGENKRFNEVNLGIGIASAINKNAELIAGYYNNSYEQDSFYAGADIHTSSKRNIRAGVSFGVITGYEYPVAVMPNVVITSMDSVRIKIGLIPGINDNPSALTISFGIRL